MQKTNIFLVVVITLAGSFLHGAEEVSCTVSDKPGDKNETLYGPSNVINLNLQVFKHLPGRAAYAERAVSIIKPLKMNFKEQSVTVRVGRINGAHDVVIKGVGAALLLWATKAHESCAIRTLLKKPHHLARPDVVDGEGKNALVLAEERLASMNQNDKDYQEWHEIVSDMRDVFRFFLTTNARYHDGMPDFLWRKLFSSVYQSTTNQFDRTIACESMHHFAEINGYSATCRDSN